MAKNVKVIKSDDSDEYKYINASMSRVDAEIKKRNAEIAKKKSKKKGK